MSDVEHPDRRRVLVIDDQEAIHRDFRKIFAAEPAAAPGIDALEAMLFGHEFTPAKGCTFEVDFAFQGEEGLERVRSALREGAPYALAFVDVRMPPGWDGVETLTRLWQEDGALQAVLCTAYADYSFVDIQRRLPQLDRYLILKKPFEPIEACQMAYALTEKWLQEARVAEANRRLSLQEQGHRALLDALPDVILRIDRAGACLDARVPKGQAGAWYARCRAARGLGDLVPADVMPSAVAHVEAALERGGPELFEFSVELSGERRLIEARAVRSGAAEVVAVLRDVTLVRAAEAERARHREQELALLAQAEALAALSVPFIPVGEHVAVVPLVGSFKARRLANVQAVVLEGISTRRYHTVIFDMTGVPDVDAEEVSALLNLARAARLLGARLMFTGLSPAVAQRWVELDIHLPGVPVHQTLLRGIQEAVAGNAHDAGGSARPTPGSRAPSYAGPPRRP